MLIPARKEMKQQIKKIIIKKYKNTMLLLKKQINKQNSIMYGPSYVFSDLPVW